MSIVPATVFVTSPAAPLPSPLAKPFAPPCFAPSTGFVKTPDTPLHILDPALENPLTKPSPTFFG